MSVGIDLIEIERVEQALERQPRLAARLFTAGELEYARSMGRPGRHLAARFAAKEAVMKALGLKYFAPTEIEIVRGDGEPTVRLSGRAAQRAQELGVKVSVSLTHSRDLAAAVAQAQ